jgi:ATP-dependent RNA helicase DDX23/PRP28
MDFEVPPPPPIISEETVPPPPEDAPPPPPPPPPADKLPETNGTNGISIAPPPPKKVPLNIEQYLKQKKAADAEAAKLRIIPKAERLRLEKQKEEERLRERAKREEETQRSRATFFAEAYGPKDRGKPDSVSSAIPTGPKAFRHNGVPTGPAAMRAQPNKRDEPPPPPPPKDESTAPSSSKKRLNPEEKEAALIRLRYMGSDNKTSNFSAQKKRKRTAEKKFNFDWDAEEDTSQDYNPIYQNRIESTYFGRGRLGGFVDDDATQTEQQAQLIERYDHETGAKRAQLLRDMAQRRQARNNRYALDQHWSTKPLSEMRERDWRIFKEDFNIATKGGSLPNPMRSWHESALPVQLLKIIDQSGYREPTAVQRACIPIALQSRDLIGVAVTGSGKTAAFILPLLVYISDLPPLDEYTRNDGPYAIILAPTRELAQQIEIEAKKFASPLGFKCVSIVGGHSIEEQAYSMREGAHIVIATPGRLIDCIERRVLVLNQCCYVIMDEADRMIDLGFEESVNKILDALPVGNQKPDSDAAENAVAMSRFLGGKDRYRQTMMYTATMPPAVERIARSYLRRPAQVMIGNVGEAVDTVEQRVEFVSGEEKRKKRLEEILHSGQFAAPIIVFVNIKRNCDAIARDIKHMGYSTVTLHGSKTQEQREAALASLRNGQTEVLVATDLAGRGIDVPDVSLVVNFNMSKDIESYTHRIGRTGRAGKTGTAITFLGNEDSDVLYDLKQMMMKSSRSKVPDELRKHEAAQQKKGATRKVET